jgi:hypothetical protein
MTQPQSRHLQLERSVSKFCAKPTPRFSCYQILHSESLELNSHGYGAKNKNYKSNIQKLSRGIRSSSSRVLIASHPNIFPFTYCISLQAANEFHEKPYTSRAALNNSLLILGQFKTL